jgi:hypothetical protein
MFRSKRFFTVLSLAGYLLATTAIHALHDHSCSDHSASGLCCQHESAADSAHACDESAHHGGHSAPTNCEDSCFACRFLAAKSIVPAVVLPVERFETVCPVEALPLVSPLLVPIECSFCRGPPAVC